ncbi:MAG: divalent-cation tolerance protein CutA [Thermodesulfovibrionia bacterium]|nr:MAG: divalent-cation tolerance protein CutA [Thermodesulfovibrionia bacterium]
MNSAEEIVILITAPKEEEAARIAKALVEKRLAACVNVIKDIRSIYRWQGKIEDDTEVLLIVKTKKRLFEALAAEVKGIHSYTVPEIIALPIVQGQKDYLKWLSESTRTEEEAVKNSRKGFK